MLSGNEACLNSGRGEAQRRGAGERVFPLQAGGAREPLPQVLASGAQVHHLQRGRAWLGQCMSRVRPRRSHSAPGPVVPAPRSLPHGLRVPLPARDLQRYGEITEALQKEDLFLRVLKVFNQKLRILLPLYFLH